MDAGVLSLMVLFALLMLICFALGVGGWAVGIIVVAAIIWSND